MSGRGQLGPRYALTDAINQVLLQSPVDSIAVPLHTELANMAWKFEDQNQPTRIIDCTSAQLLEIIAKLTYEISVLQERDSKLGGELNRLQSVTRAQNQGNL